MCKLIWQMVKISLIFRVNYKKIRKNNIIEINCINILLDLIKITKTKLKMSPATWLIGTIIKLKHGALSWQQMTRKLFSIFLYYYGYT